MNTKCSTRVYLNCIHFIAWQKNEMNRIISCHYIICRILNMSNAFASTAYICDLCWLAHFFSFSLTFLVTMVSLIYSLGVFISTERFSYNFLSFPPVPENLPSFCILAICKTPPLCVICFDGLNGFDGPFFVFLVFLRWWSWIFLTVYMLYFI